MKKSYLYPRKIKNLTDRNLVFLGKRYEMIKLLNKIVHKLHFRSQTFYLAVFYLDLLMELNNDLRVETTMVSALILAAKFDENDTSIPNLPYFKELMEDYFISLDDLRRYEIVCLRLLDYKLDYITAYHFINFFLSHGIIFTDESILLNIESNTNNIQTSTSNSSSNSSEASTRIKYQDIVKLSELTKEALLIFIEDARFRNYSSLQIACGCLVVARDSMKIKEPWSQRLSNIFKIHFEDFKECYDMIKIYLKRKCYLKELEISNYLNSKIPKPKEKLHSYGDNEIKIIRDKNPNSDQKLMNNIKLRIEHQMKEVDKQSHTDRTSYNKRDYIDNNERCYHYEELEINKKDQDNDKKNILVKQDKFDCLVKESKINSMSLINKTREMLNINKSSNIMKTSLENYKFIINDQNLYLKDKKKFSDLKLSAHNLFKKISINNCFENNLRNSISSKYNNPNYNHEKAFHKSSYTNNLSKISFHDKNFKETVTLKDYDKINNGIYIKSNK